MKSYKSIIVSSFNNIAIRKILLLYSDHRPMGELGLAWLVEWGYFWHLVNFLFDGSKAPGAPWTPGPRPLRPLEQICVFSNNVITRVFVLCCLLYWPLPVGWDNTGAYRVLHIDLAICCWAGVGVRSLNHKLKLCSLNSEVQGPKVESQAATM